MISQPSSEEEQTSKNWRERLALLVATFFYTGFFPWAPGTLASLLTVVIWVPFVLNGAVEIYSLAIGVILFFVGLWACKYSKDYFTQEADPKPIVIDEVAGQTIALSLCTANLLSLAIAFILFRFFDILKPGPVGWADRKLRGAFGVMMDDVIAGLTVLVIMYIFNLFSLL